ncbi:MAG TPA: hypothetical protein DCW68_05780 [Rhodospirillaceae bacterium]|nr:MAG: hypothetical protein A2018_01875 [Alphaproteobacteria bacterium GWF2_58_20]HAU29603.1 hypothetical protein [Rhodospirillaceae bacterium]
MTIDWKSFRKHAAAFFRKSCRLMPRSDISLSRAHCGKWLFHAIFLSALLAHMVCLAALGMHAYAQKWENGVSNQGTILIAPLADDVAAKQVASLSERTKTALERLHAIPDIQNISQLEQEHVAEIISPWLGTPGNATQLPLPAVIDFRVPPEMEAAPESLQERMKDIPGLSIDFHATWIGKARNVFRTLRMGLFTSLILLGLAITCLMAVVARAAIAISRRDIATLITCGATDWYIMRQILSQAGIIALRAGFFASILFLPVGMTAILLLAPAIETVHTSLVLPLLGQLFILPIAIALICAGTAAGTTYAFLRAPEV